MSKENSRHMPPEELAMQSLTKQLFKSQLFRGIYIKRCFVEQVGGYRDVVALQSSERDLGKQLLASATQLNMFYHRFVPGMWVGISKESDDIQKLSACQLETCIWTQLSNAAFGEYWFIIKTIRFRSHEIQIKLKIVREIQPESIVSTQCFVRSKSPCPTGTIWDDKKPDVGIEKDYQSRIVTPDFFALFRDWGQSTYEFMANDVNKPNIIRFIRFLGLLLLSIGSGIIVAIRFLGIFVVRFLFEFSRLTHAATPIVLSLIEFVNKIFGAFFILLTMMWKDLVVSRGVSVSREQIQANNRLKTLTYDRSHESYCR
ncbi:CG4287 [Drosophila busckii]|uniref:CG4287 n=2 Tax=Drosophila busckii TaxID=30019 RepID=A0A0M3QXG6_DROBS|nr:CG4287 [Drosophila busckii]